MKDPLLVNKAENLARQASRMEEAITEFALARHNANRVKTLCEMAWDLKNTSVELSEGLEDELRSGPNE